MLSLQESFYVSAHDLFCFNEGKRKKDMVRLSIYLFKVKKYILLVVDMTFYVDDLIKFGLVGRSYLHSMSPAPIYMVLPPQTTPSLIINTISLILNHSIELTFIKYCH
jgi:hypothetical protein